VSRGEAVALVSTSSVLGGTLLIIAGVYQWTPLKRVCLDNCRSPLDCVLFRWRGGVGGARRMGAEHGAYCLGCCGLLIGLLPDRANHRLRDGHGRGLSTWFITSRLASNVRA